MVQLYKPPSDAELDDIFLALADPTRRAILHRLTQGEASISVLAEPFAVSLPAVAKHVQILARAGLVEHAKVGRERRCWLRATPLGAADRWLSRYQTFWQGQLGALNQHVVRKEAIRDRTTR